MAKPTLVYTTYIRSTPKKVWDAITKPEFTRQYWGGLALVSDWKKGSTWDMATSGEKPEIYKLAGQGSLSKAQQQQLTQILDDVKARVEKKAAVHSAALDAINGAGSREQIIQADKQARQQLQQIEKYGHYEGEQVTVKGQPVVIKKIHPDGSFE